MIYTYTHEERDKNIYEHEHAEYLFDLVWNDL